MIQIAYICRGERFEAALDAWLALGAGPFWLFTARPDAQTYQGRPTDAGVRAAMTYLGDVQVEVLAPLDDLPSAWSDWTEPAGGMPATGMFHHVLIESEDYDATLTRLLAAGAVDGWAARLDDGRRVSYVDARPVTGHFIEVIEPSVGGTRVRDRMLSSCAQWKGERPRRDYAELLLDPPVGTGPR